MSTLQKGNAASLASLNATSPPIVALARILGHFLSTSYALLSRTTLTVALALLAPLSVLYNPISYLLAPVFVLASVLLDVLVFTPYAVFVAVARSVYPLYVFVGSAVLCALLVGFLARALSAGITRALFGTPNSPTEAEDDKEEDMRGRKGSGPRGAPVRAESREKSALRTPGTSKTRLRKRVSIQEERSR